jgi:hypothetical protein
VKPRNDGTMRLSLQTEGQTRYYVGFDDDDPFRFADRPQDAPVVHFGGPLTARLYGEPLTFRPGRTSPLDLAIGTPGLGKGSFAALQTCTILSCQVAPVAEIEFPPRDPKESPIRVRVKISED